MNGGSVASGPWAALIEGGMGLAQWAGGHLDLCFWRQSFQSGASAPLVGVSWLEETWGPEGTHPGWMGMGTRRRKLCRVCFCHRLFRTQEQTFPTSLSEYSGLRFNLPFIHMLMRP